MVPLRPAGPSRRASSKAMASLQFVGQAVARWAWAAAGDVPYTAESGRQLALVVDLGPGGGRYWALAVGIYVQAVHLEMRYPATSQLIQGYPGITRHCDI